MLVDLGSSNGTTLIQEGKSVKIEQLQPIRLTSGDLIVFGLSSRKYRVEIERAKDRSDSRKDSRSRSRSPRNKSKRR